MPKAQARAQPFSAPELKATLAAIDRFEQENPASLYPDLWRVLAYTGLRPGAFESLEWREVDLRKATITIRAENAKPNETFTVPIAKAIVDVLTRRKKGATTTATSYSARASCASRREAGVRSASPSGSYWRSTRCARRSATNGPASVRSGFATTSCRGQKRQA